MALFVDNLVARVGKWKAFKDYSEVAHVLDPQIESLNQTLARLQREVDAITARGKSDKGGATAVANINATLNVLIV